MKNNFFKILIVAIFAIVLFLLFAFDLQNLISLENLKEQRVNLQSYSHENGGFLTIAFSLIYILTAAFSLPFAAVLTLLGGAIFGFVKGLIIVSFASSIGATLSFLMARFLFKDWVQNKYGKYFSKINEGFAKEGTFHLFALRIVPAVPFFMVNVLMALVPIKVRTFYLVSQIGMLFGTAVYVYAGTELSKISSLSDIASPTLLLAFTLLGILPLVTKKILNKLRKRRSSHD